MIMHSKLCRRHTWPFELVEVVCQEIHTDPHHPHFSRGGGGNSQVRKTSGARDDNDNNTNGSKNGEHVQILDIQEDQHRLHLSPSHAHENIYEGKNGAHPNSDEETRLLPHVDTDLITSQNENESESKNKSQHNACTCSSKSLNVSNNQVSLVVRDKENLSTATTFPCTSDNNSISNYVTAENCKSVNVSGHQNNEKSQNQQTAPETNETSGKNNLAVDSNCDSKSGESQKTTKKSAGSSGFQPIQDKFNFLKNKTRDSRKRKQKEKDKDRSENSSSSASTSTNVIKHKDYCPHSKFQQEKLHKRNAKDVGITNPSRKSETTPNSSSVFSKSSKNNEKVIKDKENECFTSTSSNNNSPSHSQHSTSHVSQGVSLGSIGTSTQGILDKNSNGGVGSSVGSGGSQSGSGLKGSVTVVTANIINCNSHHETEGKIPGAHGTATGALSLQVNAANGDIKKTITLFQNYYPESGYGWVVVICSLIVQAINHGVQLGVSTLLVKVDRRFHVGEPALLAVACTLAQGHMRFMEPPGRASLWRFPEYSQYNPEVRANDDEFWCDNLRQFETDDRCGICGDPVQQPTPRENERGGRYWRDVMTRTYSAGEKIPIHLQSNTQNHGGGLEVHLCSQTTESEQCFEKLVMGNGDTYWPLTLADGTFNINTTVQLPAGVTCERCTLRAHYRGGQNWGTCDDSRTCICQPNSGDPPGGIGCSLLASTSIFISLFLSPVWVSFCKIKSTRLSGVFGGLVASLGCLFTAFASQFHQLFFSYGAFIGVGVGLSRDASTLMVGQYFKRKREMVEIFVVAGSGIGIALMSTSIHFAISSIGWILGLQAITGALLLTFFLGTCYRSASLYHPQRRAILHLKNQKKKVKDITKREEKPPFLDFSCLRSKTLQILLLSSAFIAFGINSPLIYLGLESREEAKVDEISFVLLHVYVGAAWVVGCCLFGFIAVQKNQECRVSKQYLCQVASVICGISIIAFTAVKGYSGYVVFAWVYGFSLGGYNYALKVYTYERVRARHFARAWGFVQSSQAIPIFIGTPIVNCLNQYFGRKSGYYVSAATVFIGTAFLFLTDVRRRRLSRRKANGSSMKTCSTSDATQTPKMRRLSFAFPEPLSPHHHSKPDSGDGQVDPVLMSKELTCISEEGLAEIDFQDLYFGDDWAEYQDITSCNKVENCIASEYDPDISLLLDKRNRRWSRNSIPFPGSGAGANISSHSHLLPNTNNANVTSDDDNHGEPSLRTSHQPFIREIPVFRNYLWNSRQSQTQRSITVIDEASV